MSSKEKATQFFRSVLDNVNPQKFLPDVVQLNSENNLLSVGSRSIRLKGRQNVYVIGTGKASPTMALAMEKILGEQLHSGMIIAPPDSSADLQIIRMLTGSHPLPDEKSYRSSQQILSFIDKIPDNAIVFYLLSGGTSALFCMPVDGIPVNDIRRVFELLLQSGAAIQEVNTVRKSLSKIKGGQLLGRLNHTMLIDLIISDVPDDDLRFIGSGPAAAQEISYAKAIDVLNRYSLWNKLPETVKSYLVQKNGDENKKGTIYKTLDFSNHQSLIVSSAVIAAEKLGELIRSDGYKTRVIRPAWSGLIEDFEEYIISCFEKLPDGEEKKPQALVFYGECTVKVSGSGLGGRNQELALRMAKRLSSYERPVTFLSAGTDGIDGPTDVAGAVVNEKTYTKAKKNGINPDDYLLRNDSYRFFKKAGGHIITGPTGNNVMDLQILLTG